MSGNKEGQPVLNFPMADKFKTGSVQTVQTVQVGSGGACAPANRRVSSALPEGQHTHGAEAAHHETVPEHVHRAKTVGGRALDRPVQHEEMHPTAVGGVAPGVEVAGEDGHRCGRLFNDGEDLQWKGKPMKRAW